MTAKTDFLKRFKIKLALKIASHYFIPSPTPKCPHTNYHFTLSSYPWYARRTNDGKANDNQ